MVQRPRHLHRPHLPRPTNGLTESRLVTTTVDRRPEFGQRRPQGVPATPLGRSGQRLRSREWTWVIAVASVSSRSRFLSCRRFEEREEPLVLVFGAEPR